MIKEFLVAILFLSATFAKPRINKKYVDWEETDTASMEDIPLVTFDGNPTTTFEFRQTNDPVMVSFAYLFWDILVVILHLVNSF